MEDLTRTEELIERAVARLDDLRDAESRRVDQQMQLRAEYSVNLASQISQSAETLRVLIAATASTQAQQLSALTTHLTDRLSSLEKFQYEKSGNSGGMQSMWGYVFAIGGGVITVAIGLYAVMNK